MEWQHNTAHESVIFVSRTPFAMQVFLFTTNTLQSLCVPTGSEHPVRLWLLPEWLHVIDLVFQTTSSNRSKFLLARTKLIPLDLCNLDFRCYYQSLWTCGISLASMIGPMVCNQWPSCHQFMTRQPQSSHQSNRRTAHSAEQMCQCQNQSRQAPHLPLIKLASHLSRSEGRPYYGKWNDSAFTLLVAEGPEGFLKFLSFELVSPPKTCLNALVKY